MDISKITFDDHPLFKAVKIAVESNLKLNGDSRQNQVINEIFDVVQHHIPLAIRFREKSIWSKNAKFATNDIDKNFNIFMRDVKTHSERAQTNTTKLLHHLQNESLSAALNGQGFDVERMKKDLATLSLLCRKFSGIKKPQGKTKSPESDFTLDVWVRLKPLGISMRSTADFVASFLMEIDQNRDDGDIEKLAKSKYQAIRNHETR